MKKLKKNICTSSLAILLLLTGCAGKGSLSPEDTSKKNVAASENSEIELISIKSVQDSFSEISNALKAQTFDNISFADAYFTFPQIDEADVFEYNMTNFDILPDDAYDYMCKRLDELFPKMYSDEEKTDEIRFTDVDIEPDENGEYNYPTLEQYKEMEEKNHLYILTNHPTTTIDDKQERSLYIMNGVLQEYDNGYLARLSGRERDLRGFNILDEFSVIYRTENLENERIFHLESGDISIAEAVKSAEKQISEFELSERELPFKIRIENVNVMDIGNDCCAFYFGIVQEYKGMKYNCMLPDDTVWGFSTIDDNTHERQACGEAIMCNADEICRFRIMTESAFYDITNRNSSKSIVPLENAAKTASEYMTVGTKFNALSVSAVYKTFSEKDMDDFTDHDDYQRRIIIVKPCWRFVLQPLTGSTSRLYYIFVDMLTGQPYRTVQMMESEVEYD